MNRWEVFFFVIQVLVEWCYFALKMIPNDCKCVFIWFIKLELGYIFVLKACFAQLFKKKRIKWDFRHKIKTLLEKIQWLILSQLFHKWRNMLKFYKEFIFGTVERINMKISTFCHFCHQKGKVDIILMYNKGLHVIVLSAFMNLKSTSCKTHHLHIVHQNNINFSFLMTKCWNFHTDTFNSTKYKFLVKLQHVSSLMEELRQN